MKHIITILFSLLFVCNAESQEQTLIGGDIENGGFGGPVVKMTKINGETAVLVGGRGGWIINHTFVLGAGGYGLVTNVNSKTVEGTHQYIQVGYGGVDLEYIISSDQLVHFSIGLLIGGGAVGFKNNNDEVFNEQHKLDSFFVLEPSFQANLNVTQFFRISGGISYRSVSGLKSLRSTDSDLSGPSALLMLKFGKF